MRQSLIDFYHSHFSAKLDIISLKYSKLIILGGAILFYSCTPVLYSTVSQNVPMLKEKGETVLSGNLASTEDASGIALQFATAVNHNLAVISSFSRLWDTNEDYLTDYWQGSGSYFEAGLGKFGAVEEKKLLNYELFGGIGIGGINNSRENFVVKSSFLKPFVQPSLGLIFRHFELAFTSRIAYVHYISSNYDVIDEEEIRLLEKFFDKKKSTLVLEPGITIRAGLSNVKFQFQYSRSSFSFKDGPDAINKECIAFGIIARIPKGLGANDRE